MNNSISKKIQIHYYFNDNSHTMNAFVRNEAEKDMLDAIKQIAMLYSKEVTLETEAYKEGGLKEVVIIVFFGMSAYLAPSINNIITHHFTKNTIIEEEINKEILKGLKLDNVKKEKELKAGKDNLKLEDKQTARHISNFYIKINNYEKVQKIGFKNIESSNNKEYIIDRENFKNFILKDTKDTTEDENAIIEIISPILKEGTFNWKGIYVGDKISFSMGDTGFKQEIIRGEHKFSNGSYIKCKLQTTLTYDDFGDEKKRSYSVKEVYEIKELPQNPIKITNKGIKKKLDDSQGSLFEGFDFEN